MQHRPVLSCPGKWLPSGFTLFGKKSPILNKIPYKCLAWAFSFLLLVPLPGEAHVVRRQVRSSRSRFVYSVQCMYVCTYYMYSLSP